MTPLAIVIGVFGVLASCGAIKFYTSYGTRLAIVEHDLEVNNLPNLAARLLVMESSFLEMKPGIQKLSQLDAIHDKLASMVSSVQGLTERIDTLYTTKH